MSSIELHGRYVTADIAAEKLKVSGVYVRSLLAQGRIVGAERIGHAWLIPLPIRVLASSSDKKGKESRIKMLRPA